MLTKEELREIVDRYDNLMEDCWRKRLLPEDEKELDSLHELLMGLESDAWQETAMITIDRITDLVDIPFPLIRHMIDMLDY